MAATEDPFTPVVFVYSKLFEVYEGWYMRIYNQARALVDAGVDVTVLAWDRSAKLPREEMRDGIRIRRIAIRARESRGPANAPYVAAFNAAVLFYLMRKRFQVVESVNVDTMLPGLIAARLKGRTCILDLCEPEYYRGFWSARWNWLRKGVDGLERFCARRFDCVLVHNAYQVRKFREAGVKHLEQIGSYPTRSLLEVGAQEPKTTDMVVVGRLGSVYANNGFEEIVAAFRLLVERCEARDGKVPYKLFLAGRVFDSYKDTFAALVASLGEHVETIGAYDANDLPELYRRIDISLLLQGRELFENVTPTKLFESMARGKPVIGNSIGDMADILAAGECGVVVDESDPASICDAVERLGSDIALRKRMGENARRLVRDKYSWEAIRDGFLAIYRRFGIEDKR